MEFTEDAKMSKQTEYLDELMRLDLVKRLQKQFTNLVITGSIGLYLRGIVLNRFAYQQSDLDIVIPNNSYLEFGLGDTDVPRKALPQDCALQWQTLIEGVKTDIRIAAEPYDLIQYKGFEYKVGNLFETIAAKCKYAQDYGYNENRAEQRLKHENDILEMVGLTERIKIVALEPLY